MLQYGFGGSPRTGIKDSLKYCWSGNIFLRTYSQDKLVLLHHFRLYGLGRVGHRNESLFWY